MTEITSCVIRFYDPLTYTKVTSSKTF